MLIHQCIECGSLSINRIAADDDPDSIMDAFHHSQTLVYQIRLKCEQQGIIILTEAEIIFEQMYGQSGKVPALNWA